MNIANETDEEFERNTWKWRAQPEWGGLWVVRGLAGETLSEKDILGVVHIRWRPNREYEWCWIYGHSCQAIHMNTSTWRSCNGEYLPHNCAFAPLRLPER